MLLDIAYVFTKKYALPTVEAPPSYLHLFGKDEQGEDETDRGRQGRERGEDGVARLTSTKCCKCFLLYTSAGSVCSQVINFIVQVYCSSFWVYLLDCLSPYS